MAAPAPHEKIIAVSVLDPALDRRTVAAGGMDVLRYQETRDPDLVRVLPGKHARRFHLRPLMCPDMDSVEGSRVPSRFAFQLAVERIENYGGRFGVTWAPKTAMPRNGETHMVIGDDEVDEASERSRKIVHEMGALAIERANIGFFHLGAVLYVRLPSLDEELDRIARHLADTLDQSGSATTITALPASETTNSAQE